MRRRPEEDDPERPEGLGREAAGRRGPADERRDRAGGTADDDVLRRQRLEPDRVDEDVAEQPGERQGGRQGVHGDRQLNRREGAECDPEDQPVQGLDPAGDERAPAGAHHARVAVAFDVVVDRPGAARGQVAAEHRPEQGRDRREAAIGDDHRRHRGQQEQRDDPRLGEHDVVAHDRPERALAGEGDRGGCRGALHHAGAAPVACGCATRSVAAAEAGINVAVA